MNKRKRKLELISAILTIIIGFLTYCNISFFISEITYEYNDQFNKIIMLIAFLITILVIVFASMLCSKPIKNEFQKKRKWLYIMLWVLFPLLMIVDISVIAQTKETATLILSIFLLISYITLIITFSLSSKFEHNIPYKDKQKYIKKTKIEQKIKYLDELKKENKISEKDYKNLMNKYLENL